MHRLAPRRRSRAVLLAALLAWALGSATSASAAARWVEFEFDAPAAQPLDPSFSEGGVELHFSGDASVNPAGRVQQLTAAGPLPPLPGAGNGHLRLTQLQAGGLAVAADVELSEAVVSVTIRMLQIGCYAGGWLGPPSRCYNPLEVEFYAENGDLLGQIATTRHAPGAPSDADWEEFYFEADAEIARMRLLGDTNRSAIDRISLERWHRRGCGLGFEIAGVLPLLAAARRRRRRTLPR